MFPVADIFLLAKNMHGWDDSVSLSRISFWPSSFFAGELLVGRVTPLVFQAVVLRCERNPDESTNEICASDFFGIIGFHHGIRDNTHFPPGIDRNGNSCSGLGLTNRTLAETIGELHPCSMWACGAAGSALPWHGRGHRFDPDQVHQTTPSKSSICRKRATPSLP